MASVIASVTINCLLVTVCHISCCSLLACCMLFVKKSDISQSLRTALIKGFRNQVTTYLTTTTTYIYLYLKLLFPINPHDIPISYLIYFFRICTFAQYVVAIVMNSPPNVEEGDKRRHKWYSDICQQLLPTLSEEWQTQGDTMIHPFTSIIILLGFGKTWSWDNSILFISSFQTYSTNDNIGDQLYRTFIILKHYLGWECWVDQNKKQKIFR